MKSKYSTGGGVGIQHRSRGKELFMEEKFGT